MEQQKESKVDISKSVIIVLVILSVIISLIGTWAVLEEISKVQTAPTSAPSSTTRAKVSLRIIEPESLSDSVTGKVSLNIVEPKGG